MIYLVQDNIMNGTVTVQSNVIGISANSFAEACDNLIKFMAKSYPDVVVTVNEERGVADYKIQGSLLSTYGRMQDRTLEFLEIPQ